MERCQKMRKDMDYKLLKEFFQKYFVVHEQSAVDNSFSTYVCYSPDGLFWLNLYHLYQEFPFSDSQFSSAFIAMSLSFQWVF